MHGDPLLRARLAGEEPGPFVAGPAELLVWSMAAQKKHSAERPNCPRAESGATAASARHNASREESLRRGFIAYPFL